VTVHRGHPLTALAVCASLALGACGSSEEEPEGEPLPRAAAAELQKRLDEVERRFNDGVDNSNVGACDDIQNDSFAARDGIDQILAGLPDDVDPELRRAVKDSFENLRTLTEDGCSEVKPAPKPETEPDPLPEPEPEPLPEPETEPLPEETEPEETQPQVPPVPEGEGGGAVPPGEGGKIPGNGKGNGKGNGGGGAEAPPAGGE